MSLTEILSVAGIALVTTLIVGGITVAVLVALKRATLLLQMCIVVASAILSAVLSMLGAAWMMYLSPHDLTVAVNVAVISGVVSLGVASVHGLWVARNSRAISRAARSIGGTEFVAAGPQSSAEMTALAEELSATSARLVESRAREQRVEESRRELVAWIAHDLRTPLAGIMSMAEALEDDLATDPQRYHRQMREQVSQLSSMVDDLFELSKIDSGTLRLTLQEVSLYDVVSDTVADLRIAAGGREIRVESGVGGDLMVTADPRELSRAVSNLLMNAIQHTPDDAPITVSASVSEAGASVSVIDSGGGIAEADLHRLFEPGWRGASARTPKRRGEGSAPQSSGAGLGLAIVRGIVTAHNGEVRVRNVEGGCRFDLLLPRDASAPAPTTAVGSTASTPAATATSDGSRATTTLETEDTRA